MTLLDQVHHHSKRIAAICGALTAAVAIFASAVAAYSIYENEFEPLPRLMAAQNAKVAQLEDRIAKLEGQIVAAQGWVGTWSGKWNDTWKVQFQIFYTYGNNYLVIYSHEENPGDPMTNTAASGISEGNVLTWGDGYTIRKTSTNKAEAVGIFPSGTGVKANLEKISN